MKGCVLGLTSHPSIETSLQIVKCFGMKIGQDVPLSRPFKQHELTSLFAISIVALRREMEIEVEVNIKVNIGKRNNSSER